MSFLVDNRMQARLVGIYSCHRYSWVKQKDIGDLFLLSDSDIIQTSRRFEAAEGQLGKKVEDIQGILD